MENPEKIKEAADFIRKNPTGGLAFTGAGISVESGIPPFRGADGLWSKVDPSFIEIDNFSGIRKKAGKKSGNSFTTTGDRRNRIPPMSGWRRW